jgi:hypothetical protein
LEGKNATGTSQPSLTALEMSEDNPGSWDNFLKDVDNEDLQVSSALVVLGRSEPLTRVQSIINSPGGVQTDLSALQNEEVNPSWIQRKPQLGLKELNRRGIKERPKHL